MLANSWISTMEGKRSNKTLRSSQERSGTTNYITDEDKTCIYVSSPIQSSSGDPQQILAACIYHRPAQFSKQFWFTTIRFFSETMKPAALPQKWFSA